MLYGIIILASSEGGGVPSESSVRQALDVEDSPGFPVKEIQDDVPCFDSIFYTLDTGFAHAY